MGKERDFIPARICVIKQASQHSPTGQGGADSIPDNKVIEEPDINQFQGRFDPACNALVGLARLCHAGWMIVGQNDSGGVHSQRLFDDTSCGRSLSRASRKVSVSAGLRMASPIGKVSSK